MSSQFNKDKLIDLIHAVHLHKLGSVFKLNWVLGISKELDERMYDTVLLRDFDMKCSHLQKLKGSVFSVFASNVHCAIENTTSSKLMNELYATVRSLVIEMEKEFRLKTATEQGRREQEERSASAPKSESRKRPITIDDDNDLVEQDRKHKKPTNSNKEVNTVDSCSAIIMDANNTSNSNNKQVQNYMRGLPDASSALSFIKATCNNTVLDVSGNKPQVKTVMYVVPFSKIINGTCTALWLKGAPKDSTKKVTKVKSTFSSKQVHSIMQRDVPEFINIVKTFLLEDVSAFLESINANNEIELQVLPVAKNPQEGEIMIQMLASLKDCISANGALDIPGSKLKCSVLLFALPGTTELLDEFVQFYDNHIKGM